MSPNDRLIGSRARLGNDEVKRFWAIDRPVLMADPQATALFLDMTIPDPPKIRPLGAFLGNICKLKAKKGLDRGREEDDTQSAN